MKRARQRMREIKISVGSHDSPDTRYVAAVVHGRWAYHRYDLDGFTVTHVPSGRSLNEFCADLTAQDARRIVLRLHRDFEYGCWRRKDAEDVALQDDVHALIAAVAEALAGP